MMVENKRQERPAALAWTRVGSEARAPARYAVQLAEPEAPLGERAAKAQREKKVRGQPPPSTAQDSIFTGLA